MATNNIPVTAGSGTYLATNSFTEDAVTKQRQRVVLNSSAGVEQTLNTSLLALDSTVAKDASLTTIDTDIKANIVLKAGTNIIGKVTTDQTTHGTSDLVAADITKVAGGAITATNVAITDAPLNIGAQAVTSENSAITTARKAQLVSDKVGKLITLPYANPENFVSGIASVANTADTAVIAAQGAGLFIYITSISIANTGATTSLVTIETDTASAKTAIWYMINPVQGGDNITFPVPLKVPVANKNLGFVCGSSSTTQYCSISGYVGL
jgi:hypothetical protein